MAISPRLLLTAATWVSVALSSPVPASSDTPSLSESSYPSSSILTRDVLIIGGGTAGTYSAIALKDAGKSVLVVESSSKLGGNTDTYTTSSGSYDYGVMFYHNFPEVQDFYSRFGLTLKTTTVGQSPVQKYADFRNGQYLPDSFSPTLPSAQSFGIYAQQAGRWWGILRDGYPDEVPDELLTPFGQWAEQYNVQDIVPLIARYCEGFGDVLQVPAVYILQYFSVETLTTLSTGFLTSSINSNSEIYNRAGAELGSNVLYNSRVLAALRTGNSQKVVVYTPSGLKLVKAKKILVAAPPTTQNILPLVPDAKELSVVSKFRWQSLVTGVLDNTGIPVNTTITNAVPSSQNAYNIPPEPAVYHYSPIGIDTLFDIKASSASPISDANAKNLVKSSLTKIGGNGNSVQFKAFENHTPYQMMVATSEVKGFYKKLKELQGYRGVWYTGAAWIAHDSSRIWRYSKGVVESILAEL